MLGTIDRTSLKDAEITSYPLVMTNSLLLKMAIEIVDFPSYKMVMFNSYVSLPEGTWLSQEYFVVDLLTLIR